jgi:hypothetical protein
MATLAQFLRRNEAPADTEAPAVRLEAPRAGRDPFQLRDLPYEDVYFFCKKQDNSRLVREADPRAGSACWRVIGLACLMLAFFGGILVPRIAYTVAGYQLESLKLEAQHLVDERRSLELQEAQLLSAERLDKLAQGQHLVTPSANQVVHLESPGEGKVAMLKP